MIRLSTILAALAALALGALAVVLVRARHTPASNANELQLLTGFSAKETCSCVFVVGQSDAYCTAFGQQPGYTVTLTFDRTAKTVTAKYITFIRTARYADGVGCTLDGL